MNKPLRDAIENVFGDPEFLDELKQQCRSAARSLDSLPDRFIDHAVVPHPIYTRPKVLIVPHGEHSAGFECN